MQKFTIIFLFLVYPPLMLWSDVVWLYYVVHIVYAEGYYTLQEYFNFQNRKKENTVTEYPDFEWIKYCVRIPLQLTPTWQTVNNTCWDKNWKSCAPTPSFSNVRYFKSRRNSLLLVQSIYWVVKLIRKVEKTPYFMLMPPLWAEPSMLIYSLSW